MPRILIRLVGYTKPFKIVNVDLDGDEAAARDKFMAVLRETLGVGVSGVGCDAAEHS
jgi:hypothetical protein